MARILLSSGSVRSEIDMIEARQSAELGDIALLGRPPRPGRDVMIVVAEEPLCGALLDIASANGFQVFACETPLDVFATLAELGDRTDCAIVSARIAWGNAMAEVLADEYPAVQRILVES